MTTTHDTAPTTPDSVAPVATAPGTSSGDTLLLTLDEAARELRCARRSLERHVARHLLTVVHLGRSVRVERAELERFVSRHRERDARA